MNPINVDNSQSNKDRKNGKDRGDARGLLNPAEMSLHRNSSSILSSNGFRLLVSFLILLLLGYVTNPIERKLWSEVRERQPEFKLSNNQEAMGGGAIFAVMGGFRSLVANISWLRANLYWMKREPAATQAWVNITVNLDPRPLIFWEDGARMLALDMPQWEIFKLEKTHGKMPESARNNIFAHYGRIGLNFLEHALAHYPNNMTLILTKAHILMVRMHDKASAAECYRTAAEAPNPPPYAARIYATLIEELGHAEQALEYLKEYYKKLPPDEFLIRELVQSKIEALQEKDRGTHGHEGLIEVP